MLLTRKQLEERFGLSRSSIHKLMRAGELPEPVRIGPRAIRWIEAEIVAWLASRPRSHGDGINRRAGSEQ